MCLCFAMLQHTPNYIAMARLFVCTKQKLDSARSDAMFAVRNLRVLLLQEVRLGSSYPITPTQTLIWNPANRISAIHNTNSTFGCQRVLTRSELRTVLLSLLTVPEGVTPE